MHGSICTPYGLSVVFIVYGMWYATQGYCKIIVSVVIMWGVCLYDIVSGGIIMNILPSHGSLESCTQVLKMLLVTIPAHMYVALHL